MDESITSAPSSVWSQPHLGGPCAENRLLCLCRGSDKEDDFLRMALPDEIATTLSSVRTLSIRPFSTTTKYAAGDVDVQQAGKAMHVGRIVLGHYQKVRDQMQLTMQAVDVAD